MTDAGLLHVTSVSDVIPSPRSKRWLQGRRRRHRRGVISRPPFVDRQIVESCVERGIRVAGRRERM